MDDEGTWVDVEQDIRDYQPALIIYDHLLCFHHQDEHKSKKISMVFDLIEELNNICGSVSLVCYHLKKDDRCSFYSRFCGAGAIYAKTDVATEVVAIVVTPRIGLKKVGIISAARKDILQSVEVVALEHGDKFLKFRHDRYFTPVEDVELDMLAHKLFHVVMDNHPKEVSTEEVIEATEKYASEKDIRSALKYLEHTRGLITSDRRGKGGMFHFLVFTVILQQLFPSGEGIDLCRRKFEFVYHDSLTFL